MASNKPSKTTGVKSSKKLIITLIVGLIANIFLMCSNFIVIGKTDEMAEKLNNYRELQEKQIASVTKLCFDIGTLRGIRANHNNNYDNRFNTLVIVALFFKEDPANAYINMYEEICYNPLLLISGRISELGGPSVKETAQTLFEEENPNPDSNSLLYGSEYVVKNDIFDTVRW